jgi:hypothetical protein
MKNLKNLPSLVLLAVQTLALSGLVASVMFTAKPAQAATFTVNGTDYDITTVKGTYNDLKTQLQATPWWDNGSLAAALALSAVIPVLRTDFAGVPNGQGQLGPFFTYSQSLNLKNTGEFFLEFNSYSYSPLMGPNPIFLDNPINQNVTYTFAVGSSAVPEPLTILGSITAAGFGVAFRRKKNSIKEE